MRKSKLELENYGSVVSLKLEIILDVKSRCCNNMHPLPLPPPPCQIDV